ncbi:hypothetical protein Zmor_026696 [Zophobas morio]|uniref:Uncharacterized protein n=1 Tax=Zophobas morio TaxID=2755281 RepID=A0AA38M5P7_9CUCU|nr:hypothetical protein Zmor_026696 [Zophobas morio]
MSYISLRSAKAKNSESVLMTSEDLETIIKNAVAEVVTPLLKEIEECKKEIISLKNVIQNNSKLMEIQRDKLNNNEDNSDDDTSDQLERSTETIITATPKKPVPKKATKKHKYIKTDKDQQGGRQTNTKRNITIYGNETQSTSDGFNAAIGKA